MPTCGTTSSGDSDALPVPVATEAAVVAGPPPADTPDAIRRQARAGVAYGLAAYAWWGLVPIYFKAVVFVGALEVLAHRVVWSVVLLSLLMLFQRRWRAALEVLRSPRTALTLAGTTVLIASNWFVFIWAVGHDRVLESSLGYFINPLVNVLLGFVFLGERLTRWQSASVLLAGAGVAYLTLSYGRFPWIALVLAGSFGVYGLLRKTAPVGSLVGLTVETSLLCPLALGYLVWLRARGDAAFGAGSVGVDVLLALAGVVTAVPLLWFASAARRLRLATVGFLQYLAPTGHFLLAVLTFGEPFTRTHLVSFACIWTALAVYSIDTARGPTRQPR